MIEILEAAAVVAHYICEFFAAMFLAIIAISVYAAILRGKKNYDNNFEP